MAIEGLFETAIKLFVTRGDDFLVLIANNTQAGDFPGGRLSTTDSLFDIEGSMRREIAEELGVGIQLVVSREPLFVFPYRSKDDTQEVLGMAHVAEYRGGDIELSDEHREYQWMSAQEALPLYQGSFLSGLKKYLSYKNFGLGDNPIQIG